MPIITKSETNRHDAQEETISRMNHHCRKWFQGLRSSLFFFNQKLLHPNDAFDLFLPFKFLLFCIRYQCVSQKRLA